MTPDERAALRALIESDPTTTSEVLIVLDAVPALLDALDAAEDRCTGCGQPWQGCVTAPNRGGIKCCPDCSHPIEDLAWNGLARERDDARAALDRVRAECAEYVEWLHEDHGTPETWPTGTVHTALVPVPEILRAIEGES